MRESQNKEVDFPNVVRGFMIYENLHGIIEEYIEMGDGYHALPVFDEDVYYESDLIDVTAINLIKLLATGFGMTNVEEAIPIVRALREDRVLKKALRFRSRHPLFANGSPLYQNICLVSGMIHLGIPILPYHDGVQLLIQTNEEDKMNIERLMNDEFGD